jgi:hypothetical protein
MSAEDDTNHNGQQRTDTVGTTIQTAVNYPAITSKPLCNAQPTCIWKKNACVNR